MIGVHGVDMPETCVECKMRDQYTCNVLPANSKIKEIRRRDDCPLVDLSPLTEEEEW